MTVTIKYNSQLAESTISSYMKDWTEKTAILLLPPTRCMVNSLTQLWVLVTSILWAVLIRQILG